MARPHVKLLGGFAVNGPDGAPLKLPTRKTEALLARLAYTPGRAVGRAELVKLLWGDRGREQGQGSLRQALTAIIR